MADGDRNFGVCLGKRLRASPLFTPLGVKPNWEDYSPEEQDAIRAAWVVHYPSPLYEDVFASLGKKVFPRGVNGFIGNKIRQTNLFQLLGVSHPRTRLYYGRDRMRRILDDFDYPFIAKTPVGSSMGRGVRLIGCAGELRSYLDGRQPAYIQERLPVDRDMRVVVISGEVVHAYWRIGRPGDFRNNVTQGASISYDDIPEEALAFAARVARRCRFDEVGLDICVVDGRCYVIEANMAYGLEGFHLAGMDIYAVIARRAESNAARAAPLR